MVERKFEEVYDIEDYEIWTDSGWEDVKRIGKTVPYTVWILKLEDGYDLECADTHIVFDESYEEVFVKDLKESDLIQTLKGVKKVLDVKKTNRIESMYDIELQEGNRRYFTNGILSHNTLWLCHIAASLVQKGFNVAYYTAEMAEESITKRLDSNILELQMRQLGINLNKGVYLDKVNKFIKMSEKGRLFVKEYPTGFGTRDNILQHLEDLKLKEGFVPDAIVVDSVNIFASSRLPNSLLGNSYIYQKAVAEEFRAIGVEKDLSVISATQLNRESANKSADNMDTTGTSDSWGIPATADWMGAIIQPQEMYEQGKYLLKNIKTRFDETLYQVETVGVDRSHMRLFDVDESEKDIPIALKDKMEAKDKLRTSNMIKEDDTVFLFDEDFE